MKRRHVVKKSAGANPRPLCPSIRPLLPAYMMRELDAAPSALVREHLLHCADCAAEALGIQRALDALRAADPASSESAATLAPRRRKRTLWLMEHPLAGWFFLHRHITGIICAIIVLALVIFALSLIKPFEFFKNLKRTEVIILTPSPTLPDPPPLDDPPPEFPPPGLDESPLDW
ncbi:MAG: zf-HC2 domain-containing protein [Kiritimatiellaeota bacterium]|nr:zf-HC2 domain-containing protein [Kiritimatiellota bacterium]